MNNLVIFSENQSEKWHQLRLEDITSTDIAALYGFSPYLSEYQVYYFKKNKQINTIEEDNRIRWGNALEEAIAYEVAKDFKWEVKPLKTYMRLEDLKIGSSFDFEIVNHPDGDGILEIKNVDFLQYKNKWIDDGSGDIQAPLHIEIQLQHQLLVSNRTWGAIAVLIGGNDHKVLIRKREDDLINDIKEKVKEFWEKFDKGIEPKIDYKKDSEFISNVVYGMSQEKKIIEADKEVEVLISAYLKINREIKQKKEELTEHRAKILEKIKDAEKVKSIYGILNCNMIKEKKGEIITEDMVGNVIGARAAFRNFRFTPVKPSLKEIENG